MVTERKHQNSKGTCVETTWFLTRVFTRITRENLSGKYHVFSLSDPGSRKLPLLFLGLGLHCLLMCAFLGNSGYDYSLSFPPGLPPFLNPDFFFLVSHSTLK